MLLKYPFKAIPLILLLFTNSIVHADDSKGNPVQVVKGRITSFQSQQPIPGATIRLVNSKRGAYTDNAGYYRLNDVPIGRQTLGISAVGFEPQIVNIVLTSGKEEQVNIQLNESYVTTDTVNVTAKKDKFTPVNEAALVSSTLFTVDDVRRFAGSRMDIARMAQNYAGVLGADDLRNDIIIRGGSPTELLWRIDGLDVPNPNHFATQGATGGPISALNSNLLDNSDFITGALPAEYGDRMSGAFDIHTRKGNDEKYEFLGEIGFNGLEGSAEGPLPMEKSSFIIDYRYAFLDLLQKMGFSFGFAGIPKYQDCMLKMDWSPSQNDQIALTGLYGVSNIDIKNSELDTVFTGDFNIQNGTDLYTLGLNWQHLFSENSYSRLTLGYVYGRYRTHLDSITTDNNNKVTSIVPWFNTNSVEGFYTLKYNFYYNPNPANLISAGIETRMQFYNLQEQRFTMSGNDTKPWLLDTSGNAPHIISFINWNWRLSEDITANIGVNSQYFSLSNKYTLEPRLGLKWKLTPLQSIDLGFGIHRQSLPLTTYYYGDGNTSLDFMKSIHYVLGYSIIPFSSAIIKVEGYYKDISNVPVERDKPSSLSFLNSGTLFGGIMGQNIALVSTGRGRTYGSEISFIKNFENGYYITATASYVRQQYVGSDGIWRFGAFDNIYIFNLLAGYEWKISPAHSMEFAFKYTTAGGAPYTPLDFVKSAQENTTAYLDTAAYSLRNPAYSRFDLRIDFKENFKGWSLSSFVSTENTLNKKNVLYHLYDAHYQDETIAYQTGFFFVGGFVIEF